MFGKPRDIDDTDILDSSAIDGFFGDEAAAANAVEVHELHRRVEQVEAQISSQFTSLATYAQISQEQIELARSEARAATERSEQRLTSLVERERADRLSSTVTPATTASTSDVTTPDVFARLDVLDHTVAEIRAGLDECLRRQRALADAITTLFERFSPTSTEPRNEPSKDIEPIIEPDVAADLEPEITVDITPDVEPAAERPMLPPPSPVVQPFDGPLTGAIADLSLR